MLPMAAVEVLWKEREDALGATKDARREVKEERLAVVTVENIQDAALAEVAHLREELKGIGRSLFPCYPPMLPSEPCS